MDHRSDIEGLRAIAVIAVLLFHFGVPGTSGGYVGVDVFFVISGFLITTLLVREKTENGRISLRDFYARRARRLLPVSATVIVVSAVSGLILLNPTRLDDFAEEIVAAALFFPNLLFASRGADYLGSQLAPSPLQHFWSLAVEEQFYLLWPVAIAIVARGANRVREKMLALTVVMIAGSFAMSMTLTSSNPSWSYFGPHTRAWELGIGALLALLWPFAARISREAGHIWGWLGLSAILWSVVMFDSRTVFPGLHAALPVIGTALIIATGRSVGATSCAVMSVHTWLSRRPMQLIGARSYSLYLWHWPPLVIIESWRGAELSNPDKVAILIGVVAMTELTHRLIENRIRRSPHLIRRPQLSLNLGAALVLVGVAAATVPAYLKPQDSTGVVVTTPTLATSTTLNASTSSTSTTIVPTGPVPIWTADDAAPQAVVEGLSITVAPDNLAPPTNRAEQDVNITYDNDCHQFFKETIKEGCIFGDPEGTITLALFGDSHAAQWFSPLNEIAIANGWRLIAITQGGCTPIELSIFNVQNNGVYRHCAPWRANALEFMIEQGVDYVFTGQYVRYRDAGTGSIVSARQWRQGYTDLTRALRAASIEPIFFGDTPDIPGVPPECIAANRRNVTTCVSTLDRSTLLDVMDALRRVAREEAVSLIEPQRWLCHEGRCPVIVGNISVYRDDNHISDVMARWLQPLLAERIIPFVTSHSASRPPN